MIHDAFSAGVEPGGLYSSYEIKILICYMLKGVGEPMSRQAIMELLSGNGMANFFETGAAIDELVRLNNLVAGENDTVSLTETGEQIAATLSGMIPYTLRERSVKAALQMLTRIRRERENSVTIERLEHGVAVTCTMNDSQEPLMSVTLRVADELQAELIKENFLNDPTIVYRSMLAVLTGDAGMERADTRIIIQLK